MATLPRAGVGRPSPDFLSQLEGEQAQPAQIPRLLLDPTWSLGCFPIEIDFGGATFTIPPLRAVDWLVHLFGPEPNLYNVVAAFFTELEDQLFDNMSEDLTVRDLYETVMEAMGMAAGRPWWVAIRLISVASVNWHVIGPRLIMSGVNAETLSLSAWLDCVLAVVIELMDPKEVIMFSSKLELKPENPFGFEDDEPQDAMDSMAISSQEFLAFGD